MREKLLRILTNILIFLVASVFCAFTIISILIATEIEITFFVLCILILAPIFVGIAAVYKLSSDSEKADEESVTGPDSKASQEIEELIRESDSTFVAIKEELSCWNWQIVTGSLIFCCGIWNLFSHFFLAIALIVLGLGLWSVGKTKYSEKKELQERALKRKIMAAMAKNAPPEAKTEPASAPRPQPVQDHTLVEEKAEPAPTSKPIEKQKFDYASLKSKTYKLAGVTQYVDNIKSIGTENEDYYKSQRELIAEDMIDERIWRYEFPRRRALLKPEPDNPVDPKAIKVFVDCEHVGYIKSGSCAHVHKLLDNHAIAEIICTIGGGPYKCITEEYDEDAEEDVYVLEKGEINFFVHLEIVEKFDVS